MNSERHKKRKPLPNGGIPKREQLFGNDNNEFNMRPRRVAVPAAGRRLGFNAANNNNNGGAAAAAPRRLGFNAANNNNGIGAGGAAAAAPQFQLEAMAPDPENNPAEQSLLPYKGKDIEPQFYTFDKCFRIDGQYHYLVRPGGSLDKAKERVAEIRTEKYNSIAELLNHPGIYTYMLFSDNEFRAAKALNPGEILNKHKNLHRNSGAKDILLAGEIQVNPDRSVIYNFLSGTYMPSSLTKFMIAYKSNDPTKNKETREAETYAFFKVKMDELLTAAGATSVQYNDTMVPSLITTNSSEAAIAPFLATGYTLHSSNENNPSYPTYELCEKARKASPMQGGGMAAAPAAVAVFAGPKVQGEAVAIAKGPDTILKVKFTKLPAGEHGFHIHRAGDLRGKGCTGACAHFHKGPPAKHGPAPSTLRGGQSKSRQRHTGDLGNVSAGKRSRRYTLKNLHPSELFGRSLIVHADRDDLGLGGQEDSHITGHSGKRIACAIFGRGMGCK